MNKVTAVGGYKNTALGITDAATNVKNLKILTQYDPNLICWFNFHSLMLATHDQVIVKIPLNYDVEYLKRSCNEYRAKLKTFILKKMIIGFIYKS